MISINNISYFVGGRALYEKASLHVKPKDRIGLIGLNGKGKTTLLRLINGEMKVDEGDISFSNECSIGFLNQDLLSYQSSESIKNVALEAFSDVHKAKEEIESILKKLESEYSDELIAKLGKLQDEFEKKDGYTIESQAEAILEGIGFSTADLERPLHEFSGGWRMRVMLAKLLLEKPSLLMLDEPTNHLDLPSIQWIENYLQSYEGAVMVVSHDRNFLDNVCTSTVEVDQKKLIQYSGNYSFYQQEKQLRKEIQQNTYDNQQKQIRQTERFVERFRAKSTKARQVQSKIKLLDKMDKVEEVASEDPTIHFRFSLQQKSGKKVIELKDFSKSYGDLKIFEKANATIMRGDKIALIGANGKGKSTLLRVISGSEKISGKHEPGYNVIQGFYAQHQLEDLDVNNDILSELKMSGSGKTEQELRNVLGCFLFSDEDVFKKIKVLSGGEKSRVALAKTLISEANFLLLDEPTNHLDFISENILINALDQYEGIFIVVSHNRHFISKIANKIWYIEDHQLKEYPGTYEEYVYWEKAKERHNTPDRGQKTQIKGQVSSLKSEGEKGKEKRQKWRAEGQLSKEKERKVKEKEIQQVEARILQLEEQKEDLENKMSDPANASNLEELNRLNDQYEKIKKELDAISGKWEELIEVLSSGSLSGDGDG